MGEVVGLALRKWQRYFRQREQQPPPLGAPSQGTALPTMPTTVCLFDHLPGDPPLLWSPTPRARRSAVLLKWPKR
jgi:hypothetical protein